MSVQRDVMAATARQASIFWENFDAQFLEQRRCSGALLGASYIELGIADEL